MEAAEGVEGETGTPVTISVAGLGGPLCAVEATTVWTIRQVQLRIFELTGAPLGRQGLFKGTEKLRPNAVLGALLDDTSPEALGLTLVISQAQWRFSETAPVDCPDCEIERFGPVGTEWLTITEEGLVAENPGGNGIAELSQELLPETLPVRIPIEMPSSQAFGHYLYLRHPDYRNLAGLQISAAGRYHVTITTDELQASPCHCGAGGAAKELEPKRCRLPWSCGTGPLHFGAYLFLASRASLAPCDTCTWA